MTGKSITILVGGTFHDFEGFGEVMASFLGAAGYEVDVTWDADVLCHLAARDPDIVMLYTCLGGSRDGDVEGTDFTAQQTSSLVDWVRGGGALLALHASTVTGPDNREMRRLLGGYFVSHPPGLRSFTVMPVPDAHSVTKGIEAFEVFDELYVESCDDTVQVHMTAMHEDANCPMVWSRPEGKGRVVHIAPGHDRRVWELPAYRRIVLQSLSWATPEAGPER